jgi:hypothetical protein
MSFSKISVAINMFEIFCVKFSAPPQFNREFGENGENKQVEASRGTKGAIDAISHACKRTAKNNCL